MTMPLLMNCEHLPDGICDKCRTIYEDVFNKEESDLEYMLRRGRELGLSKYQCSLRTKLFGDGCATCNPERAKDLMEEVE